MGQDVNPSFGVEHGPCSAINREINGRAENCFCNKHILR